MAKKMLRVDMDDVLTALEGFPPGVEASLDPSTGRVHWRSEDSWSDADDEIDDAVAARLISIPQVEGREEYRWMEAFAADMEDGNARAELVEALAGKGAFSRFRHVVGRRPEVQRRWEAARKQHLLEAALAFFEEHEISPVYELTTPPAPEPEPAPKPKAPPIELLDLLLLGAPEGKTELTDGALLRQIEVRSRSQAEKLFAQLARQICEQHGLPWRRRMIEGRTSFEMGRMRLSVDERRVQLQIEVPPETWRAFFVR